MKVCPNQQFPPGPSPNHVIILEYKIFFTCHLFVAPVLKNQTYNIYKQPTYSIILFFAS